MHIPMICDVRGLQVYYESLGEGMPVFSIHGFGVDHRAMKSCLEPIFKGRPGYRRIYFDMPGMGRTKASEELKTADDLLDVIIALIDRLIPDGNFLVAGSSFGALLERGVMHRMPERIAGALLLAPVMVSERSKRELPTKKVLHKDDKLLSAQDADKRKTFELMTTVQDERTWKRYEEYILPALEMADNTFSGRIQQSGFQLSFDVDRIEPLEKPVLLVTGRQDTAVGYKDQLKILDNYPRGTFAILDRASHNLEIEQETVFNCLVNEWLDRVEES
jgi:pimeloyl-ACP methyl ester carboxylesterase